MSDTYPEIHTDESVALQVQQGHTELFGVLVERYEPKMTRYAQRFLRDPADREDALQEIFLRAYEHLQTFNPHARFSPWLYRVAHNVFVNSIRRRGRERISFVDLDTLFPMGVPDEAETRERITDMYPDVEQRLSHLPAKYREVLVLFYFEEKSYEEIADILHIPKATVGVRLKRARDVLKDNITNTP